MKPEPLMPTSYLEELNSPQRQAVEAIDGPLLVLAGAGTGKTRVLTTRIAHIILNNKAFPWQILSVTFTNKAAHEMKERVNRALGHPIEGLWLGTFHALCVRILRKHIENLGYQSHFTILDADDQLRLIKQILKAENLDEKKWPPRLVASKISLWKDRALLPEQVTEEKSPIPRLYAVYQERLKILNALDFGDLLLLTITLFRNCPHILDFYQQQFRYILVDEYQDTNVAQYLWLRLLAQHHKNICCVGDDDQSIYGWRGAEVTNILKFEQDFAGAQLVRLEQNYRSTPHILGAASALIAKNTHRLGKTLWTKNEDGNKVVVKSLWNGEEEARYVGDTIESLQRKNYLLQNMAILVRASHQTREFEERLMTLGIPYRVIGGPRFYERLEIRDAVAYLRLIYEPNDSLAFERIINTPKRGLGNAALQTLHQTARYEECSLFMASHKVADTDELRGQARQALKAFINDIGRWRHLSQNLSPSELAKRVLDESGYTAHWQKEKTPESMGRLENLKEFVLALKEFETLESFLEHVSLVMETTNQANQPGINVMTLHSAKGLEFDIVFLAGWEEGLFPNQRTMEESGIKGLEEERRLAYVGLTRARKQVYILYAASRKLYGGWQSSLPSRFISELPSEHVEFMNAVGLFVQPQDHNNQPYKKTTYLASPKQAVQSPLSGKEFNIGERIFHIKFGYGRILDIQGDKVDVEFEHAGYKKVINSFLEKTS